MSSARSAERRQTASLYSPGIPDHPVRAATSRMDCCGSEPDESEHPSARAPDPSLMCALSAAFLDALHSRVNFRPSVTRGPIQYELDADWLAGAAGFEPLHLEIRSAELHPASTGFRRRSGAPLIRDAQVRVPPPGLRVLANSDLIIRCRGSNPAAPARQSGFHRVTYEGRSKPRGTARFLRYGLVSVCRNWPWKRHSGLPSPGAIFDVSFLMAR